MIELHYVELYEIDRSEHQKKIATFRLLDQEGSVVEIEGDYHHPVIEGIMGEGIFDYKYARPGKLYPYDGMNFLENLRYHFRSGYLSATDVKQAVVED